MEKNIKIYENFLDENYINYLSDLILNRADFPWFFTEDIAGKQNANTDTNINQFGFFHLILDKGILSFLFEEFNPVLEVIENKCETSIFNVERMRIGMQTRVSENSIVNYPHIDYAFPHKVLLLYLNNSDGDTIFYEDDKKTVLKRVSPQKNKAVLFDGKIWHSSSTPSKYSRRVALNINFNLENG